MQSKIKFLTEHRLIEFLIIRPHGENFFDILLLSQRGEILQPFEQLNAESLAALAHGKILIVIIPGSETRLITTKLTFSNQTQLKQAIPFSLEDTLGHDLDDLQFAIDIHRDQQRVLVIRKEILKRHITFFNNHNLTPHYIMPEFLIIPPEENTWHVHIEDKIAQVRISKTDGFSIDKDLLNLILTKKLAETSKPPKDITVSSSENTEIMDLNVEQTVCVKVSASHKSLFNFIDSHFISELKLNLLQGHYRNKFSWCKLPTPLKTSTYLFFIFIVLFLVKDIFGIFLLNYQSARLNNQNLALFNQILPNTPMIDIQSQVRTVYEKQIKAQNDQGFLNLLAEVGRSLSQHPNIQLQTISYQQQQLSIHISSNHAKDFELLLKQLNPIGLKTKVTGLSTQAQKNNMTLLISRNTQ